MSSPDPNRNEIKRPPGPPPNVSLSNVLKPPPQAPPPRDLQQAFQRPPVTSSTPMGFGSPNEIKRPPGPPPIVALPSTFKQPPQAPPPRDLQQQFQRPPVDRSIDASFTNNVKIAEEKPLSQASITKGPPPTVKAGAIPMFSRDLGKDYDDDDIEDIEELTSGRADKSNKFVRADSKKRQSTRDTADSDKEPQRKAKTSPSSSRRKSGSAWGGSFKTELADDDDPSDKDKVITKLSAADNLSDTESKRVGSAAKASRATKMKDVESAPSSTTAANQAQTPSKGKGNWLSKDISQKEINANTKSTKEELISTKLSDTTSAAAASTKDIKPPTTSQNLAVPPHDQLVAMNVREHSETNVKLSLEAPKASQLGLSQDVIRKTQGRFTIKCVEGNEIRPDTKQRDTFARANISMDAWLKFRLMPYSTKHVPGSNDPASNAIEQNSVGWKSTKMKRKLSTNPLFDDELVMFSVTDMNAFVRKHINAHDDIELVDDMQEEDVILQIEVWIASALHDVCIGTAYVSLLKCLKEPYETFSEVIPLVFPNERTENGTLSLDIVFEQAIPGVYSIALSRLSDLLLNSSIASSSAAVTYNLCLEFCLGPAYKKRNPVFRVITKPKSTCSYDFPETDEFILLSVGGNLWVYDMVVKLYDLSSSINEKLLGEVVVDVLPYMNFASLSTETERFELLNRDLNITAGNLDMEIEFSPCGKLKGSIDSGKKFMLPAELSLIKDKLEYINVYLKLKLPGLTSSCEKQSKKLKFGPAPNWSNELFEFDIVDEYLLNVELYVETPPENEEHEDATKFEPKSTLIGQGQISLLNIFKSGFESVALPLKIAKPGGRSMMETGTVHIHFVFSGSPGIAYPQNRPNEIPCYDETARRSISIEELQSNGKNKPSFAVQQSRKEEDIANDRQKAPEVEDLAMTPYESQLQQQQALQGAVVAGGEGQEFTDEEIVAAFKFLDLDGNNFIGAREIRHILICMGEMITDEEVDMMISMVDNDGDGQISFAEFRALVLNPRLGEDDDMETQLLALTTQDELKKKGGKSSAVALQSNKYLSQKVSIDPSIMSKQPFGNFNSSPDNNSTFSNGSGTMIMTLEDLSKQRQKEMKSRENKKIAFQTFVVENHVTFEKVKLYYHLYLEVPRLRKINNMINFNDFIKCLAVEPMTEYRLLFNLFLTDEMAAMIRTKSSSAIASKGVAGKSGGGDDGNDSDDSEVERRLAMNKFDNEDDDTGKIDFREFLLSLLNFIDEKELSKETRIRFSFAMFDEGKTGLITVKEVEEILRGNHMVSLLTVKRKAETIMKQASADHIGSITMNEFVIISKKFPNILIPTINK